MLPCVANGMASYGARPSDRAPASCTVRARAMSSPPWMLIRLALETGGHHAVADEDRLKVMDAKTRAEYRAYLVRIYGFEAPVEEAIAKVADLEPDLVRERQKVSRLHADLVTLGLTPEVGFRRRGRPWPPRPTSPGSPRRRGWTPRPGT